MSVWKLQEIVLEIYHKPTDLKPKSRMFFKEYTGLGGVEVRVMGGVCRTCMLTGLEGLHAYVPGPKK